MYLVCYSASRVWPWRPSYVTCSKPRRVHLVPVCNTLPRNWQELHLCSPEVWTAERAAFVCSACLTSLFCARLSAYGTYWFWRTFFPFDYIQNKVTPARVLGSSACARVWPRSWVRPRLPSSVSQAIASARVAPPVSVTDLGRHGLAPPRVYCRSVCSDLVLWIRAFVFSRRHNLIIFVCD